MSVGALGVIIHRSGDPEYPGHASSAALTANDGFWPNSRLMPSRRDFVRNLVRIAGFKVATMFGMVLIPRTAVTGPSRPAIEPDRFREALRLELGGAEPEETGDIVLEIPRIAEDGAIVPVMIESHIPATDRLSLFVQKNPFPLIAAFQFADRAAPFVSLRIKMNESSAVIVIARAKGKHYRTAQWVRVVRGGCG